MINRFKVEGIEYFMLGRGKDSDTLKDIVVFTPSIDVFLNKSNEFGFENVFVSSKNFFDESFLKGACDPLGMNLANPINLGKYMHYKDKEYNVIGVGKDIEFSKSLVIYRSLYKSDYPEGFLWTKDKNIFFSDVENQELAYIGPRFIYLGKY